MLTELQERTAGLVGGREEGREATNRRKRNKKQDMGSEQQVRRFLSEVTPLSNP